MTPREVFLVRHSLSEANQNGLVTGDKCDCLTHIGEKWAEQLKHHLSSIKFSDFYVSDWQRARQTAKILKPKAKWIIEKRLGETDAGETANWPLSDFLSDKPNFYTNPKNTYPNGESHIDMQQRVGDWLEEQNDLDGRALVVSHSGPINALLHQILNVDMTFFPAFKIEHLSVSSFKFSPAGWDVRYYGASLQEAFTTQANGP